jgi:hypothetical protein
MGERKAERESLEELIAGMNPEVLTGRFVFANLPDGDDGQVHPLATVKEQEGMSVVLRQEEADRLGIPYEFVAAWITLRVESALEAVGLTAAVSTSLAAAGISCNVIAGFHHDHLLVPADEADRALATLRALSAGRASEDRA